MEKEMKTLGIRLLSTMSFMKDGMVSMPIIDTNEHTITFATYQKHVTFTLDARFNPRDEAQMYRLVITCLDKYCDVAPDLFKGPFLIVKQGLLEFGETQTSVRVWNSKKVGKSLIFKVTVSSYKDAVPEPMKTD